MCQVARLPGSLTTLQGDVAQRQPQVVNYVELQELSYKIGQLSWLVVSTPLKIFSQIGSFPQVGMKIKNIWNHQPVSYY